MMENWIEATGPVISTIGTDSFSKNLSGLLQEVAPYDYTVIFGYHGADRPMDLFDDFPRQKRKIFVEDYQAGPYLLDPFYLACENRVAEGLYRIRDIAPDRFFQGEYFRSYYVRTGLAEEIGYFITLPEDVIVVVSLMREKKAFTAKEMRQLRQFWPIVQTSCQRHWTGLAARFGEGEQAIANTRLHQSVQRAFLNIGEGILTPRERQVVEFTLKGHSADAVGRLLEISPGTVRIHRRNVYAKLRIRSQGELFSKFIDTLVTETGG